MRWFEDKSDVISKYLFQEQPAPPYFIINLILALGVTYYVRLEKKRNDYARKMTIVLGQGTRNIDGTFFMRTIEQCQDMFVDELTLDTNVAKNEALKVCKQCFKVRSI